MRGQITRQISNLYTVTTEEKAYECNARGRFRNDHISPLVGDYVEFDPENQYILEILPRKNELKRPSICNIDQAVIVTSYKHPDFQPNLLDKMIVILEYNNIHPIICFTKLDLASKNELSEFKKLKAYYQGIGYTVLKNTELTKLKSIFKNKLTVFTGQTGVGKSTLLNKLDKELNLKTNEISEALGRGKHTTRHVELYPLYHGLVADTPGFSALDFHEMTSHDIRDNFIEFHQYGQDCKYRDCMHLKEDHCKVKDLVASGKILQTRYENYQKFLTER